MRIITKNEKETLFLGKKIAAELRGGEILALFGDLGAGKTTFTKGIAQGLGIKKTITSPTFNIMKVYPLDCLEIKKFVHVDAYRLTSAVDAENIGLLEQMIDPSALIVVEWPENIWELLKNKSRKVHFKFITESEREINIR